MIISVLLPLGGQPQDLEAATLRLLDLLLLLLQGSTVGKEDLHHLIIRDQPPQLDRGV